MHELYRLIIRTTLKNILTTIVVGALVALGVYLAFDWMEEQEPSILIFRQKKQEEEESCLKSSEE